MSSVKRRKVPRDENSEIKRKTKSSHSNLSLKTNKLRFYFLTALVFSTCLLGLYLYLSQWTKSFSHGASLLDNISLNFGLKKYVHAIVIDAGSTGTRVLHFGFINSSSNILKLHQGFFKQLEPGISAYADKPAESVKNLEILLNLAKRRIPEPEWSRTPLFMKATAGLRLLPKNKADALMKEAKKLFMKSGLKVDDDSVSILDEIEEGLFSWFTINFLLDRLGFDDTKTVAALDLGGGSMQVSFVPSSNEILSSLHSKYLTKIAAFHKELNVYSRSYLGLGLNEGRKRVFEFNSNHSTDIKSECINPLVKKKWNYGGVEYTLQGPENPEYRKIKEGGRVYTDPIVNFAKCENIVKNVVSKFGNAPSLKEKEIFAFSYFFGRLEDSGLISNPKENVSLYNIRAMAKTKCQETNVDQPFMCLDLTFITVLLENFFDVPANHAIYLVKSVDNIEVSWALGAAFLNLQKPVH